MYVAAIDNHNEEGVVISDVFTTPPVRHKIQENRRDSEQSQAHDLCRVQLHGAVRQTFASRD